MIYILSGIAKAGKTLLSAEILEKHKISHFSTDYIMMMLARGNSKLSIDVNASDSTVAKSIEPYVYGMIKTMIENKDTYLIEGVHFTTDFSRKLLDEFKDDIRIIYLGYKDISKEDKIKEVKKYKHLMNNPWLFDFPLMPLEEIIEYMIGESKRIYDECQEHNLEYIDVYDINKQKNDIISMLLHK